MKIKLATILATGAASLFALTAHAVPTLTITSGATTITVVDGGANDSSPIAGQVSFMGTVGAFTLTLDTGASKPYSGTGQVPYLQLNSTAQSAGAGTLTIVFSDTGFGPSGGVFRSTLSGLVGAGGTADFKAYDSTSNTLNAQTTLLTSLSGSGVLNAAATGGGIAPNTLYSLTQVLTITHTAGGTTSVGATTTVPDGGSTLALIGLSLMAVVGVRRMLGKEQAPSLL